MLFVWRGFKAQGLHWMDLNLKQSAPSMVLGGVKPPFHLYGSKALIGQLKHWERIWVSLNPVLRK